MYLCDPTNSSFPALPFSCPQKGMAELLSGPCGHLSVTDTMEEGKFHTWSTRAQRALPFPPFSVISPTNTADSVHLPSSSQLFISQIKTILRFTNKNTSDKLTGDYQDSKCTYTWATHCWRKRCPSSMSVGKKFKHENFNNYGIKCTYPQEILKKK